LYLALTLAAATPAHAGLIFNTTFDLSGDSRSLNANLSPAEITQWENAIIYVEMVYSSLFSNDITVNLTVDAAAGTSTLGASSTSLAGTLSYQQVKGVLAADVTSSDDHTAVANLPAADPTGGAAFWLATAQAKALGLLPANDAGNDGTVTFGAGWNYTFDPNHRAVPGDFDFIGVAEHEISEVMGRFGLLGTPVNGNPGYAVLDLFGYTSSGVLNLQQQVNGAYFSIDGGSTNLKSYNDAGNGGDAKDWASGTNDSYNAFSSSGAQNDVTAVDVREMDVIGYTLATPEPGSLIPLLLIGAAFAVNRRRPRLSGAGIKHCLAERRTSAPSRRVR